MFDSPYSFLKIFGILIGIALFFYYFQAVMTTIAGFFDWIKRKKKYEADKLKYSQLPNKSDEIVNKKGNLTQKIPESVNFHLLKLVNSKDNGEIHFSITGGAISNIEIGSEDLSPIIIDPKTFIANNSSGHIYFAKNNPMIDKITFWVNFDDAQMIRHSNIYLVSLTEEKLQEL
jgi:hypothetical protein